MCHSQEVENKPLPLPGIELRTSIPCPLLYQFSGIVFFVTDGEVSSTTSLNYNSRYEVLEAVNVKIIVYCNVTP